MSNKRLRLGVVLPRSIDSLRSRSCRQLCRDILEILKERFKPRYFFINGRSDPDKQRRAFKKFTASCQLILELPVHGIIENQVNSTPIVFFALDHMAEPVNLFMKLKNRLFTCNSVLFSSNSDLEIFSHLFGKVASNMGYFIPFPLDVNKFRPLPHSENEQIRNRFNIRRNCPLILYTGRIYKQKNLDVLLKIFHRALKVVPEAMLCIAGGQQDRDYTKAIRDNAVRYRIRDRIIFTGYLKRENLIPLYSSADVFLNCSTDHENFGFSAVEAMACGTPVICSKLGGMKDTVIDGKTGYHIPAILDKNGIKLDWQKGLTNLTELLTNKSKLNQMSQECVKHARENFSFDQFTKRLNYIFSDTLRRKKAMSQVRDLVELKKKDTAFMNSFMHYLYLSSKQRHKGIFSRTRYWSRENFNFCKSFVLPYISGSNVEIFSN